MILKSLRPLTVFTSILVAASIGVAGCGGAHAESIGGRPNRATAKSVKDMFGTSTTRCSANDIRISIATGSATTAEQGKVLESVGMGGVVIAYLVTNIGTDTCALDGYMLPRWSNVPGSPQPYRTQQAMAPQGLTSATGSRVGQPGVIEVPSGQSAGFVVAASSELPAEYVLPGGIHAVPVPSTYSGSTTGTIRESPISAIVNVQSEYCEVLNGTPTCIQP